MDGPLRKGRPISCPSMNFDRLTDGRFWRELRLLLFARESDMAKWLTNLAAAAPLLLAHPGQAASPTPTGAEHAMVVSAHRLASRARLDGPEASGNPIHAAVS